MLYKNSDSWMNFNDNFQPTEGTQGKQDTTHVLEIASLQETIAPFICIKNLRWRIFYFPNNRLRDWIFYWYNNQSLLNVFVPKPTQSKSHKPIWLDHERNMWDTCYRYIAPYHNKVKIYKIYLQIVWVNSGTIEFLITIFGNYKITFYLHLSTCTSVDFPLLLWMLMHLTALTYTSYSPFLWCIPLHIQLNILTLIW